MTTFMADAPNTPHDEDATRAGRLRAIRARREELYGADRNDSQLPDDVIVEALELQAQFAEGARRAS